MLPSLPSTTRAISRWCLQRFHEHTIEVAPLLGQLRHIQQHEGDSKKFKAMTASASLPMKEVPPSSLEPLGRAMKEMAEDRARKELKLIEENVESHALPADDDELLREWMDRLAAHDVEFDRFGVPALPSHVCHPDDRARLETVMDPRNWSAATRQRWQTLIEKKREEFLARETRRSLAG